jgi:peptidoglycan/LPS O-acetylase OafA/YrhL
MRVIVTAASSRTRRRSLARPARLGYRPALDGLRALAIALVVLHHTGALLVPSLNDDLFPAGFLGVNVFFVLSGFLITTLLLERRGAERRPIRTFYLRRALRLLPAVVALLLGILLYALVVDSRVPEALRALPVVLTYTTNWAALAGVDVSPYVGHLWSLAIEEQFYLVWPLLLFGGIRLGCSRRQLLWLILGLVILSAAWRAGLWETGHGWLRIYIRTDAQADSILIGAALALLPYDQLLASLGQRARSVLARSALALVLAAAELLQPDSAALYLGGFTVVALAVAALLAAELRPGAGPSAALTWAPAIALGRVSYALYLWHFPVFLVISERTGDWPAVARVAVAWSIALGAAVASYRLVERPALRIKDRLGPRRASPTSDPAGESQVAPAQV